MVTSRLSFLLALVWTFVLVRALPTWLMDEYPPDLITVVNYDSSGGELYLKSSAAPGMEGDCVIERSRNTHRYSKDHDRFAPNFFIRGGELYAVTNSTHVMRVVALRTLDHETEHYHPGHKGEESQEVKTTKGPFVRYKLQLVDPHKALANTGPEFNKYAHGTYSWAGPILLYSFTPEHEQKYKGSLFYSCPDGGIYMDVHNFPPPVGCQAVTLHARNVLRLR